MTKTIFSLVAAICAVLGLTARSATAEELSVATYVPPQHHTNTSIFAWFGEEIEGRSGGSLTIIDELGGLPMSLELAKSFDGADDGSKKMIAEADKGFQWVVVSDEERAKMDAAVQKGLHAIFADYESNGITNAREIYEALNQ